MTQLLTSTPDAHPWAPTLPGLSAAGGPARDDLLLPRAHTLGAMPHAERFGLLGDADRLWQFLMAGDALTSEDAFRQYLEQAARRESADRPWFDDPAGRALLLTPLRLQETRPIIVRGSTSRTVAPDTLAAPSALIGSPVRGGSILDAVDFDLLAAEIAGPVFPLPLVARADAAILGQRRGAAAPRRKRGRWVAAGLAAAAVLVLAVGIARLPDGTPSGLETAQAKQRLDGAAVPWDSASGFAPSEQRGAMSNELSSFARLVASGPERLAWTANETQVSAPPPPVEAAAARQPATVQAMVEVAPVRAVTGTAAVNDRATQPPAPLARSADLATGSTTAMAEPAPQAPTDTKPTKRVAKRRKTGPTSAGQLTRLASSGRPPITLPDALRPQ